MTGCPADVNIVCAQRSGRRGVRERTLSHQVALFAYGPALRTCRAGWDDSVSVSDLDTLKFINALIDHLESAMPLPGFTCQTFDPLVMAAFRSVK